MGKSGKWLVAIVFLALLVYVGTSSMSMPGADEKVGEVAAKYAAEIGVKERPPLINTDKGDLLLFVFAAGGAVAGFYLGYQWRGFFGKKNSRESDLKANSNHMYSADAEMRSK
ncbi:hypothetical protein JCM15765_05050 [Paradesulfitobacterium aromaticivorans]